MKRISSSRLLMVNQLLRLLQRSWCLNADFSMRSAFSLYTESLLSPSTLFFFFTAFLRYNSYAIQFTHVTCVIQWFLVIFTDSATSTAINFKHFHHPKKKPRPRPLFSVLIGWPVLHVSYKWNHTVNMWPFVTGFFHLAF